MRISSLVALIFILIIATSCGLNLNATDDGNGGSDPDNKPYFSNVTSDNLPDRLPDNSRAAKAVDINNNGNLDIAIAVFEGSNIVLGNDGNAVFFDESDSRLPATSLDSRDIAAAYFNTDNNYDLFFASGENRDNELYLNDDAGNFSDLSNRIPIRGNSTSVESFDIDGNGSMDLLIGNRGQNAILINNGNAFFSDQTNQRLPQINDNTENIIYGDITGNGLVDIVVANQENNLLLINTGSGFFSNQSSDRLNYTNNTKFTHAVTLADIDNDGDLDIYFGNVDYVNGNNSQDRLLVNNGQGVFEDQTSDRLPVVASNTSDAAFVDLDDDGDYDLIAGSYDGGIRVLINDGNGNFKDQSADWISDKFSPDVIDIEIADFNNDDLPDIYIVVNGGKDQILLQTDQ